MIRIQDIWSSITELLPPALQESYDNCGLQVGDPSLPATGVLCCVDITEQVLQEALQKKCNVIIAHHPLLFKGLKRIGMESDIESAVYASLSVTTWRYMQRIPMQTMQTADSTIFSPRT